MKRKKRKGPALTYYAQVLLGLKKPRLFGFHLGATDPDDACLKAHHLMMGFLDFRIRQLLASSQTRKKARHSQILNLKKEVFLVELALDPGETHSVGRIRLTPNAHRIIRRIKKKKGG